MFVTGCSAGNGPGTPTDAGTDTSSTDVASDAPADAETKKPVGAACHGRTDCVEGARCIGDDDGTFQCMAECSDPYEICGDGSVCLPVSDGSAGICYIGGSRQDQEPCTNNLGCAPGLLCFGASGEHYCRNACHATAETCGPDTYCRTLSTGAGLCRPTIGEPCATDTDCAGTGLSCTAGMAALDAFLPGGYCTVIGCASDADCPSVAVCRTLPGAPQAICLLTCDHDSDCRFTTSYRCLEASDCASWSDPQACRDTFGASHLCAVPR